MNGRAGYCIFKCSFIVPPAMHNVNHRARRSTADNKLPLLPENSHSIRTLFRPDVRAQNSLDHKPRRRRFPNLNLTREGYIEKKQVNAKKTRHSQRSAFYLLPSRRMFLPAGAETRRALLVGIDKYDPPAGAKPGPAKAIHGAIKRVAVKGNSQRQPFESLDGAVSDMDAVKALLMDKFGFREGDIKTLTNQEATADEILSAIQKHLIDSAQPGDVSLFYYAGHGSLMRNLSTPKPSGYDSTIVPADWWRGTPDIRDKELARLFRKAVAERDCPDDHRRQLSQRFSPPGRVEGARGSRRRRILRGGSSRPRSSRPCTSQSRRGGGAGAFRGAGLSERGRDRDGLGLARRFHLGASADIAIFPGERAHVPDLRAGPRAGAIGGADAGAGHGREGARRAGLIRAAGGFDEEHNGCGAESHGDHGRASGRAGARAGEGMRARENARVI